MKIYHDKIETIEFPDLTGLGIYHFKSEYILWPGSEEAIQVSGFGTAEIRELAHQKSVFELFERISFRQHAKRNKVSSTNGFAAHMTYDKAAQNAIFEVVERGVFFNCWLKKTPPKWIEKTDLLAENGRFKMLQNFASIQNCELKLGLALNIDGLIVVVGVVLCHNKDFGGFFNTAASDNLQSAVDSIVFTLCRYFTIVENRKRIKAPVFTTVGIPTTPVEHFEHYLDPQNFKKIKWFFEQGSELTSFESIESIKVEAVQSGIEFPIQCKVAYASSAGMQGYYVGMTNRDKLVPHFSVTFETLNEQIHPLP